MSEELAAMPEARWRFARVVYNMDALLASLTDRLKDAKIGLQREHNELYQEYDRRLAEGEFRQGVSIPLIGILVSTSVLFLNMFSIDLKQSVVQLLVGAASIAGGTVHAAGTHKVKEAAAHLYGCINRDYVGLDHRHIFGSEMFVPTETTAFTRMSEFAYWLRELRTNLGVAVVKGAALRVGRLAGRGKEGEPSAQDAGSS
jgi:hypothetical protein